MVNACLKAGHGWHIPASPKAQGPEVLLPGSWIQHEIEIGMK